MKCPDSCHVDIDRCGPQARHLLDLVLDRLHDVGCNLGDLDTVAHDHEQINFQLIVVKADINTLAHGIPAQDL